MAARKGRPKKEVTLEQATISVLRNKLIEVEAERDRLKLALASVENMVDKMARGRKAAEEDTDAMLNAIRILAEVVPSSTYVGRHAREQARSELEARKIRPPYTLGSSRNRPKGIRKKKP